MREPAFWWRKRGGSVLAPLAAIYGAVAWGRIQAQGKRAGVPVICLGNLTVGGAGKTPAALAVAHLLLAVHERPFFLSRGYGGKLAGPVRVDPAFHNSADVGDEPLMLARLAPTIVARDRVAGARMARSAGSSVIVMDDGFQNPSLVKDLAILMVDGRRGIGNGRVIPAGPLRAPLEIQISRARALVVVGPPDGAAKVLDTARRYGVAVFHGRLEADRNSLAALGKRKVLAFAGIGNPEKFFSTLTEAGIEVAERSGFPDHHRYTAAEAQGLLARAQAQNLMLITTEKDHVRLAGDPALAAVKAHASVLPVRLVIDEQEQFRRLVLSAVKRD
ncbi:MAG TPA: tetraacyldisaccharide 4'-kinase [Xanthobacteraceae bacterium]|jgi:tetraacyldisaccharide 4'-kinase|nr:tetraacyldisaccharide 4'-kinase [Xanthobacteraceae bacterium]